MLSLMNAITFTDNLIPKIRESLNKYAGGIFTLDCLEYILRIDITEYNSYGGYCCYDIYLDNVFIVTCTSNFVFDEASSQKLVNSYIDETKYIDFNVFVEDLARYMLAKFISTHKKYVEAGILEFFRINSCVQKDITIVKDDITHNLYHLVFNVGDKSFSIRISLCEVTNCYSFQGYCIKSNTSNERILVTYTTNKKVKDIETYIDFQELLSKFYTMLQAVSI